MNERILTLCRLLAPCVIALGCGASPADPIPPEPDATGGQSAATSASLPGTGGGASKATGGQSALGTGSSASNATGGQGTGGNAATGGSAPRATGGQGTGGNAATGGSSAAAVPECALYVVSSSLPTFYRCVCNAELATWGAPSYPAGCTPGTVSGGLISWGTCHAWKTNVFPTGEDATAQGVNGGGTAVIYAFDTASNCTIAKHQSEVQS